MNHTERSGAELCVCVRLLFSGTPVQSLHFAIRNLVVFGFSMLLSIPVFAQITWTVEPDSVNLNPPEVSEVATLLIGKEKIRGMTIFNFENKEVYFKGKSGMYRLNKDDIQEVNAIFGLYSSKDLFNQESVEEIRRFYRQSLYPKLNLNKVVVSYSKNARYDVKNDDIIIRNASVIEGKICAISPFGVLVVDSTGKLSEYTDRDIVYIDFLGGRYFRTTELYRLFYVNYDVKLSSIIAKWESNLLSMTVGDIIRIEGPFDREVLLNAKKIYIWEKQFQRFYVDLNSRTVSANTSAATANLQGSSFGTSYGYANALGTAGTNYSISSTSGVSSLFLSDYSLGTFGYNASSSRSSFNGEVTSKNDKISFSLVTSEGEISDVLHYNVFSSPQYGRVFVFVRF